MNKCAIGNIVSLLAMAALSSVIGAANAADYTGEVRVGFGTTDNIARTAQGDLDETVAAAGFEFGMSEKSRRLNLTLRSSFDYFDYLDDTYDQEWLGGLSADATISMIEERLEWVFEDDFGQQLSDPFQSSTPNNREDVNFFSTGPTLNFLIGGRNLIRVDARYGRVDYDGRPDDNDRLSGAVSLGRYLSRDSTLELKLESGRVEYDEAAITPPYEVYSTYLRYEAKGSRNSLSLDLGYNEVEYAGIDADGVLLGIDWTREVSPNSSVSVSAGSRYSDQGDIFQLSQTDVPRLGDTQDVADSNSPFLNNNLNFDYSLRRDRYSVVVSLGWNQEDFKDATSSDRDIYGGNLTLRREFSREIFAGALVRFDRREFKYEDRRDDDLSLGFDVGYRFDAGFDLSLEYEHLQRNSTAIGADYAEKRAFVRLAYTPRWSRRGDD